MGEIILVKTEIIKTPSIVLSISFPSSTVKFALEEGFIRHWHELKVND